jgi:GH24 family phage-related lysozyme (muramidase)
MSAVDLAIPRLKIEEGYRRFVYVDTTGHRTIAYGVNLDAGISEFAAAALLQAQAQERHDKLMAYGWYVSLDPVRQSACIDIDFNANVLTFPKLIAALIAKDWAGAQRECQVKNVELTARYQRLGKILFTGAL